MLFRELSTEYANMKFAEADVSKVRGSITQGLKVSPTIRLYKKGVVHRQLEGFSEQKLREFVGQCDPLSYSFATLKRGHIYSMEWEDALREFIKQQNLCIVAFLSKMSVSLFFFLLFFSILNPFYYKYYYIEQKPRLHAYHVS